MDWLNKQGYSIENLTDEQLLLGGSTFDLVENKIIITTKMAIFINKQKAIPSKLCHILNILKEHFNIEKFIAE